VVERTTNMDTVIAGVLWAAVVGILLCAVGLMAGGLWQPAVLVAAGACALSAFAAVRSVRCDSIRICELIRNSGPNGGDGVIRSVR
jgi:hypothetical protein